MELLSQICKGGKERAYSYMFLQENIAKVQQFSESDSLISSGITAVDVRAVLSLESLMWCVGCLGASYMKHVRLEEKYRRRAAHSAEDSFGGGSAEVRALHLCSAALHCSQSMKRDDIESCVLAVFKFLPIYLTMIFVLVAPHVFKFSDQTSNAVS